MYGIERSHVSWDDVDTPSSMLALVMPRHLQRVSTPPHLGIPLHPTREYIAAYPRLKNGIYFADFRRDTRLHPEIYHCVIQRDGSPHILWWSQHRSLEDATRTAKKELSRFINGAALAA